MVSIFLWNGCTRENIALAQEDTVETRETHLGRDWIFETFSEMVSGYVIDEYKKNNKFINIFVDANTLRSVYDLTIATIGFHLKLDEVVHYKECAHLCFWFAKLKPIFVVSNELEKPIATSPSFNANILRSLNSKNKASEFKPHKDDIDIDSSDFSSYFLNEKVALTTAVTILTLIETELEFKEDYSIVKGSPEKLKRFKEAYDKTMESSIFYDKNIINKLSYSLRFHNHTARSLAATFESIAIAGI